MPFHPCPPFSEAPTSAPSSKKPPLASPAPDPPLPPGSNFFSPRGHYTFRDPCHPPVELSCLLLSHLLVSLPEMSSHPLKKYFLIRQRWNSNASSSRKPSSISLTGVDTSLPFQSLHSLCADLGPGSGMGVGSHRHPALGTQPKAFHLPHCPGLWSLWGTQEQKWVGS